MKKIWFGSALVGAAVLLAGCGKKDANVLTLGTDAKFPPFEMRGGATGADVVGFDVDVAQAIAAAAGKQLQIVEMDFDRLLPALADGKVDLVMAALSITPERRELADFSAPYYKATQVALILAGGPVPETKDELKGMRTAALAGTTGFALAEELTSAENLRAVASPQAAAVDLMNSQVDLAILDEQPAILLAERNPEIYLIRPEFTEEFYGVAVRKGDTNLLEVVNRTLGEISADGRYDQFVDRWLIRAEETAR
ncbi:MAG: ABC transporter substrate-binding protein [Kiritimatiellia bacterium]